MLIVAADASTVEVQARNLLSLLPLYLDECRRAGVAATSLDNYREHLACLFEWWGREGPPRNYTLTRDALAEYGHYLRTRPSRYGHKYARGTVNTYTRRARQFLRWLYTSGRLPLDISQWVPYIAAPKGRSRVLTAPEIGALMHACAGSYRLRNVALLSFLLETGARRMEAAALTWGNVSYEKWRGYAHLEIAKRYMEDDKERTVCFGETTGKLIQMWGMVQERGEERVFGISASGIAQVCSKLSRKTGVEFSAHDLRRTFGKYWIKHCQPPNRDGAERLLEVQLGHSPRTVTQRHYEGLTHFDVMEHYVSPLDAVELPFLNRTPRGMSSA